MGSRSAPIGTPTSGVLTDDFNDLLLFWPGSRFGADSQAGASRHSIGYMQRRSCHVFAARPIASIGPAEKETAVERGPAADHRRLANDRCLITPSSLSVRRLSSATAERSFTRAGLMVRIHLPPAKNRPRISRARSNPLSPVATPGNRLEPRTRPRND